MTARGAGGAVLTLPFINSCPSLRPSNREPRSRGVTSGAVETWLELKSEVLSEEKIEESAII